VNIKIPICPPRRIPRVWIWLAPLLFFQSACYGTLGLRTDTVATLRTPTTSEVSRVALPEAAEASVRFGGGRALVTLVSVNRCVDRTVQNFQVSRIEERVLAPSFGYTLGLSLLATGVGAGMWADASPGVRAGEATALRTTDQDLAYDAALQQQLAGQAALGIGAFGLISSIWDLASARDQRHELAPVFEISKGQDFECGRNALPGRTVKYTIGDVRGEAVSNASGVAEIVFNSPLLPFLPIRNELGRVTRDQWPEVTLTPTTPELGAIVLSRGKRIEIQQFIAQHRQSTDAALLSALTATLSEVTQSEVSALLERSRALAAELDFSGGASELAACLEIAPDDPNCVSALVALTNQHADSLYEEARAADISKDLVRARDTGLECLRIQPEHTNCRILVDRIARTQANRYLVEARSSLAKKEYLIAEIAAAACLLAIPDHPPCVRLVTDVPKARIAEATRMQAWGERNKGRAIQAAQTEILTKLRFPDGARWIRPQVLGVLRNNYLVRSSVISRNGFGVPTMATLCAFVRLVPNRPSSYVTFADLDVTDCEDAPSSELTQQALRVMLQRKNDGSQILGEP
jgi:hypothetical protein